MKNQSFGFRRSLSFILSVCLTFSGFPLQEAFAEAETVSAVNGSGGSISIFLENRAGSPIVSAIKAGDEICPRISAHTPLGETVPCAPPRLGQIPGFTGDQLRGPDPDGCFVAGQNMGSAEITASCDDLPNVQGKAVVSNVGGLMTPAEKAAASKAAANQAAAEQAAAESAAGMSGAQAALIGAGLGLGVVGIVVAAVGSIPSTSTSSSSSSSCPTRSQCCGSSVGSGGCGIVSTCSCPSGTTNMGICTSGGCLSMVSSGRRLCNC